MTRRNRSRGRRSTRRSSVALALLLATGLLVAGAATLSATSYSAADLGRHSEVAVVDDPNATVGLEFADSVRSNNVDRLVTITNRHDATVAYDLELEGNARDHVVFADGNDVVTTVELDPGESRDVEVAVENGAHENVDRVRVRIDAASLDGSLEGTLVREETTVTNPGGPPGGGGPPWCDPSCEWPPGQN